MGGTSSFCPWFFVFFVGAVLFQCDGQNRFPMSNDLCRGSPNSYYADIQNDCKTYLACVGGQAIWAACPMGTRFDDVNKRCIDTNKVICSGGGGIVMPNAVQGIPLPNRAAGRQRKYYEERQQYCGNKPDGLFPDVEKNCKTYFECTNGVLIREFVCGPGLSFDATKMACLPDSFTRCKRRPLDFQVARRVVDYENEEKRPDISRRLVAKRQIKFSNLSPSLLKAIGEVLEQLGENMELHA